MFLRYELLVQYLLYNLRHFPSWAQNKYELVKAFVDFWTMINYYIIKYFGKMSVEISLLYKKELN